MSANYGRNTNRADVLIIGAGLSGMAMAIEMIRKGQGRNFIIVEKGNQVGGTWNDQRYPGCCCDIWSHLYSYSFEPNPNWTRHYSGQEEILDYLIGVAHKYQLYKHLRFNTSVDEARWDEETNTWQTKVTRHGSKDAEFGEQYTVTSDFLVSAVGQLNFPQYPAIKGLNSFGGKSMHSARWDWDYDLRDKRIGIIGNGASAAQIIPEVAKFCKSLTVFQRTPNWVVPRDDAAFSSTIQSVFTYLPFLRRRYRAILMDIRESVFGIVWGSDTTLIEWLEKVSRDHMSAQIPGEKYAELREKLQPRYAIGCKRVLISDDFFPTFTRDNVVLETSAIKEITPDGIAVDGNKEYKLDLLILASGFKTTQFMYPIKIYGSGGKSIEDVWESGAPAYLGMTVPSMPNFSMLYGPNSNLGHNSIILMIEAQAMYVNALIQKVQIAKAQGGSIRIEPKLSVVEAFNKEIQARLTTSSFADPKCNSWYKNEAGLITNNWSDAVIPYQKRISSITWDEFDVTGPGSEAVKREGRTSWSRVVEETQISNAVILAGLITTAGAAAAAVVSRKSLKALLQNTLAAR